MEGFETSYGRYMGNFPVIKSLATLAYNNRRAEYFRMQLLIALHILNDGHISLKDFKGEWAGASGQPQFLPTSWRDYAVDYDQDGRKDIWKSHPDVFASIANYLMKNGWQAGQPFAMEVETPDNFDENLYSRKVVKTVREWEEMGIRPRDGHLPPSTLSASIIRPDGGPTFMVFNNFNVVMRWNHSIYYAATIGYMADKICRR
jgi:membrane-bound lytic murein transglycosylase B